MPQALAVSRVVSVSISLTAPPAAYRNFGSMLVIGSSPIIDVFERKRDYNDINGVGADFPTTSPEYQFALNFFGQSPQPQGLSVGRWAQTATSAVLHGAGLTPAQRLMAAFNAVTAGGLSITVDGTVRALTGLNFSTATNLNGVASIIQTALVTAGATGATVVWNGTRYRFDVTSGTTGATSTMSYATAPGTGTDVSVLLGLSATPNSAGGSANPPVNGVVAETALACANLMGDRFGDWYCLGWAPVTPLADSDALAVAGYIQAAGQARVQALTTMNTAAWDSTRSDDLGSLLTAAGYGRTLVEFSSTNPYAAASLFGRFATVNYDGSNTTITGKFKLQPGVVPEYLAASMANALAAKSYNIYAQYQNNTAITQEAVMSDGTFIDSRINADWLANRIQTDVYNLLRGSNTKIPQTDKGMSIIGATVSAALQQAVTNQYLAPGVWNTNGFGTLSQGDFLPLGYYVYIPAVALQSQTLRAQRQSVVFQVAAKEAGAVHSSNILINVNP